MLISGPIYNHPMEKVENLETKNEKFVPQITMRVVKCLTHQTNIERFNLILILLDLDTRSMALFKLSKNI